MKISSENIDRLCEESEIISELLALDNRHIVELGCGKADLTRKIATSGEGRQITAFEIDSIQHAENIKITDLPNVTFRHGAAESIDLPDGSVDVAFMFKSLHHVPIDSMSQAFAEIHRVLNPGGFLYVSEPIFSGEFNEILRLFHNEEKVRQAAFDAEKQAIASGKFSLVKETFFNAPMKFDDFAAFEKLVLGVTHTDFVLSDEVMQQVRDRFMRHLGADGAHFKMPIRVDLLQAVG